MSRQRESIRIADPFCVFLKHKGWHVENIHGNQYQQGLPDKWIMSIDYTPRWVEFKVVEDNGSIHLTPAQEKKWPIWIANGCNFWVVCGKDMRGISGKREIQREYNKLLREPPNSHFFLHHSTRKSYLRASGVI